MLSDSEDGEKASAKKSRVVSDADDSDSDAVSDKSGKREKTIASDSEEEAGKELSDKKMKRRICLGVTVSQAMKKKILLQTYLENLVMKRKKNLQVLTKKIWKKKKVKLR